MPALDLAGQRFGRLVALRLGPRRGAVIRWICRCDCGKESLAATSDLRGMNTTSCGCYMRQRQREGKLKHGATGRNKPPHPLYPVWCSMKERCFNPKNHKFYAYGGRGISVCQRWRDSFEAFRDDMGPRPAGHSIDRVNNDGDYEPGNCRWADAKTQRWNRPDIILFEHEGRTVCVSDYAKLMGVSSKRLYKVMSTRGLSPQDAAAYVKAHVRKPGPMGTASPL